MADPSPRDFYDACLVYQGTPCVHQGRTRDGLDCIGLLILAARDLGAEVIDDLTYSREPSPVELIKALHLNGFVKIRREDMDVGDVVRFRDDGLTHVGVVGDEKKPFSVVHCPNPAGVSPVTLDPRTVHAVYRHQRWLPAPQEARQCA